MPRWPSVRWPRSWPARSSATACVRPRSSTASGWCRCPRPRSRSPCRPRIAQEAFAGGAGDHRRDQGSGPDLEEGGGRMGARSHAGPTALRSLPAVHELAAALDAPHALAVAAARGAIDERRATWLAGQPGGGDSVTGDSVDGGLASAGPRAAGRDGAGIAAARAQRHRGDPPHEPRAGAAAGRCARGGGPSRRGVLNLELDLDSGERGSRHAHVEGLLCELTGAEAAIVVNNGAGAVLLAAAALAGPGAGSSSRGTAGRDRWRLPDSGGDRPVGRAAGGGGDD